MRLQEKPDITVASSLQMLMKWVVTFKKVHRSFQKREITSDMHSKEYHVSN